MHLHLSVEGGCCCSSFSGFGVEMTFKPRLSFLHSTAFITFSTCIIAVTRGANMVYAVYAVHRGATPRVVPLCQKQAFENCL